MTAQDNMVEGKLAEEVSTTVVDRDDETFVKIEVPGWTVSLEMLPEVAKDLSRRVWQAAHKAERRQAARK